MLRLFSLKFSLPPNSEYRSSLGSLILLHIVPICKDSGFQYQCTFVFLSFSVINLQDKWKDMFYFLDINNDNILDMADVKMIQDNFVRLHNLTDEEVNANCKIFTCKRLHMARFRGRDTTSFRPADVHLGAYFK